MNYKKIMLTSLLAVTTLIATNAIAQDKYFTREGHIAFYSEAEDESIEANNYKVTSILDMATGNMEFAVLMKAFEFKQSLMEEHFNENYVESNKFPKGTFKGTVNNISDVNIKADGEYPVTVSGVLTIHGVSKNIEEKGVIIVKNGKVYANSEFKIAIRDYDIEIPKVVVKNIAEVISVKVKLNLNKLERS
ncbi:MAG: YceI family protein [Bacteroidia bacterium]|nr:YceI family protein [Bacteroidia bacterium]